MLPPLESATGRACDMMNIGGLLVGEVIAFNLFGTSYNHRAGDPKPCCVALRQIEWEEMAKQEA